MPARCRGRSSSGSASSPSRGSSACSTSSRRRPEATAHLSDTPTMTRALPTGTVTLLFTDIEGSTRLLRELGTDGYADVLAEHRRVVREASTAGAGVVCDTQGDSFFVSFPTAAGAVAAAEAAEKALASGPVAVRMGRHTV